MADLPLRPDFYVISESFETLSTEFTRVANLPVVDSSQRVLEAIERLVTRMDGIQREMRQGFAGIENAFEALRKENKSRDRNRLVALENGVVDAQGSLKPLYSLSSGEVIANFPQRINEIHSLSSAEVARILTELKLDVDGDVRQRRRRLLLASGVRQIAV